MIRIWTTNQLLYLSRAKSRLIWLQKWIEMVPDFYVTNTVLPMEHLRDPLGLSSYLYKFMLDFYEKWLS